MTILPGEADILYNYWRIKGDEQIRTKEKNYKRTCGESIW